jgi:cell shape-determining protein MreC
MKKKSALALLPIVALLLLLMCVPRGAAERARGAALSLLAPLWEWLHPPAVWPAPVTAAVQLQIENIQLRNELTRSQKLLKELLHTVQNLQKNSGTPPRNTLQQKYFADLKELQQLKLRSLQADVIQRSPSTWNSSLWINVGRTTNTTLGVEVVALNSPVVVGNSLVGMVDYVGERQSRVRLISDSGLSPAVRVVRGQPSTLRLVETIELLREQIKERPELANGHSKDLQALLEELHHAASREQELLPLAKGELHGSSAPLWKSQGHCLKGIGFNYDFADEYGPARDLRFGTPYGSGRNDNTSPIALVKEGDLLMTTGMDGIFPAGLQVGYVTKVLPLQEGDYYYELEAKPAAGNLDELTLVFVLPSSGLLQ